MIQFSCTCGTGLRVQDEHAGKTTRCPKCGATVAIPAASNYAAAPPPPPPPPPPMREEVTQGRPRPRDDRDYGWDQPRSRAGRRRAVWPWITVAAAVLLIGLGVGAWFLFFRGGGSTADLDLVPGDAVGFVTVRVGEWWDGPNGKKIRETLGKLPNAPPIDQIVKQFEDKIGLTLGDVERATLVVQRTQADGIWAIHALKKDCDQKKVVSAFGLQEETYQGKKYYTEGGEKGDVALHFVSNRIVVMGSAASVKRFLGQKTPAKPEGTMREALDLARAGRHTVVASFNVPAKVPAPKNLPPALEALVETLLDCKTVTLTLNDKESFELEATLTYANEGLRFSAQDAAELALADVRKLWNEQKRDLVGKKGVPELAQMLGAIDQALQSVRVEPVGGTGLKVSMKMEGGGDAAAMGPLVPAVQKVREAAGRTQSANNVHQVVIALHDYNANYGRLPPPVVYDANGRPLYSWRVLLLPYLEQKALYEQFKLNEPWDSPHNKKLSSAIVAAYSAPEGGKAMTN